MTINSRLQLEDTILATRDMLITRGVELPFELKRRDPKEPGRRRKEKVEDKTYKVTMRHFRKQKKALRDNLEWHYPQRMKVIGTTDYTDLLSDADYNAQLLGMLTQASQDGVLLFAETGVGFPSIDYTLVNTQAAKWASKYSGSLIKGIDATTLASVRGAVSSFVDTPGMTIGDVMRGLGPTFSEDRALMIATTEITNAYAAADNLAALEMQKEFPDLETVKTWWTKNDALVCPICGPVNGETVLLDKNFSNGFFEPAAHPRCRCWRRSTTRFAEVD